LKEILNNNARDKNFLKNVLKENSYILNNMIFHSMKDSLYSLNPKPHLTLSTNEYCYFTSPLRRYSDIINHRAIKRILGIKSSNYTDINNELISHLNDKSKLYSSAKESLKKWIFSDFYYKNYNKSERLGKIVKVDIDYLCLRDSENGALINVYDIQDIEAYYKKIGNSIKYYVNIDENDRSITGKIIKEKVL